MHGTRAGHAADRVRGRAVGADAGGQLGDAREQTATAARGVVCLYRREAKAGHVAVAAAHVDRVRVVVGVAESGGRDALAPRRERSSAGRPGRGDDGRRGVPAAYVPGRGHADHVTGEAPLGLRVCVAPGRRDPLGARVLLFGGCRVEREGDHAGSSCHLLFAELPVHGLGSAPRDLHLLGDFCPHFGLESGRLSAKSPYWPCWMDVEKHKPLVQSRQLVLALLVPLTSPLKIVLIV